MAAFVLKVYEENATNALFTASLSREREKEREREREREREKKREREGEREQTYQQEQYHTILFSRHDHSC